MNCLKSLFVLSKKTPRYFGKCYIAGKNIKLFIAIWQMLLFIFKSCKKKKMYPLEYYIVIKIKQLINFRM